MNNLWTFIDERNWSVRTKYTVILLILGEFR